ncbi:galactose-1-phosphate uridylyltransferase [Thermoproteota archaeon]
MSELRKDILRNRWVVVDTEHPKGPMDFIKGIATFNEGPCPFCSGNEWMTPAEIDSIRPKGTPANSPGWNVRTVANKFPALKIEGGLDQVDMGIYEMLNGVGAHEVIIETPEHDNNIPDRKIDEIEMLLDMYCRRAVDLQKDKRFKYVLFFKNHGVLAGASLAHPHTQLIALPMIPKNVIDELANAKAYLKNSGRCAFCDIVKQERDDRDRILFESDSFIAFCPYVSRFPFEIHILPKTHQNNFFDITGTQRKDLATILKRSLYKLKNTLTDPSYNYIIHTAPLDSQDYSFCHWHLEIIPRLTKVAGFEWGSGFYVVPTPPEVAIQYLKEADIQT